MGVTSPDSLPWPVGTAVPDGPLAFQNLATATQTALTDIRTDATAVSSVYGTVTVATGPTSGTTELVLATAPAVTCDGVRNVEVQFSWYNIVQTVGTDVFLVRLYDGATAGSGTLLATWLLNVDVNGGSGHIRRIFIPSAASHTFTGRVVRSSGTGTATLGATSGTPAQISVRTL